MSGAAANQPKVPATDDDLARELGAARMQAALDKIQRAQNLIADAQADLSAIEGASKVWHAGSKVHDKVKAYWYTVDAVSQRLRRAGGARVDGSAVAYEQRRREGAPGPQRSERGAAHP